MQRAYISKLLEIAENDDRVLHLVADSGTGFDELFHRNFPRQMINFGIAEEHMVAAAAGMATSNKIPFVYTAGAFLAYRAMEFIRDDICFQNLNVKVIGMGSGLAWSSLGPSHHTTEDIAVLRAIPNLEILSPATPLQAAACVEKAYRDKGPVYVRIGMNNEKEFFTDDYHIPSEGQDILKNKGNIIIFTTGSILEEVMDASEILENLGVDVTVINVAIVKPFYEGHLLGKTENGILYVTVEEHNVLGGLGSIVSEVLTKYGIGKKLLRIGLNDVFAEGYGSNQKVLRKQNYLDAESIVKRIMEGYNE